MACDSNLGARPAQTGRILGKEDQTSSSGWTTVIMPRVRTISNSKHPILQVRLGATLYTRTSTPTTSSPTRPSTIPTGSARTGWCAGSSVSRPRAMPTSPGCSISSTTLPRGAWRTSSSPMSACPPTANQGPPTAFGQLLPQGCGDRNAGGGVLASLFLVQPNHISAAFHPDLLHLHRGGGLCTLPLW